MTRVARWPNIVLLVPLVILTSVIIAVPAAAQYPFVPPPVPCIPRGEGPGILAGVAPTRASLMLRRDMAVLQFTQLPSSGEPDLAVKGMRDRLEARLRAIRPSAMREYAGPAELQSETAAERAVQLSTLGKKLGARRLLAGRISQDDASVQVVLEAYDAGAGRSVWQTRRQGATTDLLALELELAREVAKHEFRALTASERVVLERSVTRDGVAYSHYVRGIAYLSDSGTTDRAIAEFAAATQRAPRFAEAWSNLAVAYTRGASAFRTDSVARDSVLRLATAAANRSSAIAPRAAHTWIARGTVLTAREPQRFGDALVAYERAVMLEPGSAEAHRRVGHAMLLVGRAEGAQLHLLRAVSLDPGDPSPLVDLGELELDQHAYGQSCRALDLALAMNPRLASAYVLRAMARLRLGDVRPAWADAETGRRLGAEVGGEAVSALVDVVARDTSSARDRVRSLQRLAKSRDPLSVADGGYIALGLVAIGDRSEALELLERLRPRGAELFSILRRPGFDPLWSDIRFRRLVEESNAEATR